MCRSITTASGSSRSASSIASRPLAATPATVSAGCCSISGRSDSTKLGSSSASRTRTGAAADPSGWSTRSDVSLAAVSVQPAAREVALIGVPLDLGAGRRGVDMGPSAIRYAELEQHLRDTLGIASVDLGNVVTPVAESTEGGDERARFLPQILAICDVVAKLVAGARRNGQTPLVLGGDHSVALGSLVGMAAAHGPGGVIWIDAHGDLNTPESSPSGNVHGMVLAAALGLGG